MNVLFMTLLNISNLEGHGIYEDLLKEFSKNGHDVYIVSATERRNGENTHFKDLKDCKILKVKTGNIQKTNIIEKGISTVLLERQFVGAIKTYLKNVRFDIILYSTPPITVANAVAYIKKRDGARTYLLLKDIFPQNAVDIGMMSDKGIKGILFKFFKKKEEKLYTLSERIGCMSPANVEYILQHNPQVPPERVEVCPNSVEPIDMSVGIEERRAMREKYGIPQDKTVFIYGGNLGKPQGIPFLIECLKSQKNNSDVFFLIVGDGTEYRLLEQFVKLSNQKNMKLMKRLPKEDYDRMVGSCDVGMIFLDHRFTIPNFPSRLLSYMQAKIPVLAVTDPNTDIGKVIINGEFGWWSESDDVNSFSDKIHEVLHSDLIVRGERAWQYLNQSFSVKESYKIISKHIFALEEHT